MECFDESNNPAVRKEKKGNQKANMAEQGMFVEKRATFLHLKFLGFDEKVYMHIYAEKSMIQATCNVENNIKCRIFVISFFCDECLL